MKYNHYESISNWNKKIQNLGLTPNSKNIDLGTLSYNKGKAVELIFEGDLEKAISYLQKELNKGEK